jgi:hypothetical protein
VNDDIVLFNFRAICWLPHYINLKVLFVKLNRTDSLLLLFGNQNSEGSSGMTAMKYRPVGPSC